VGSEVEKDPVSRQEPRAAVIQLHFERFGATKRPLPMINSAPLSL
jgi:hypothetical protein